MIVERFTYVAKPGRRDELIEWFKEVRERQGITTRIYSTTFGTWNRVTWDLEFETEEDRKKYWAGIDWTPELKEFLSKLYELVVTGHTRELLTVH